MCCELSDVVLKVGRTEPRGKYRRVLQGPHAIHETPFGPRCHGVNLGRDGVLFLPLGVARRPHDRCEEFLWISAVILGRHEVASFRINFVVIQHVEKVVGSIGALLPVEALLETRHGERTERSRHRHSAYPRKFVWSHCRQVPHHSTTPVMPYERCGGVPDVLHQRQNIARQVLEVVVLGWVMWSVGPAVSAHVRGNAVESGCRHRRELVPPTVPGFWPPVTVVGAQQSW
mmetsp:Transcript_9130/g.23460  ORF Transcript_9130/g.23460 Transcript_9130/m.23460 type:complete len:230 (+) Transcript_9130:239-928(+)